MTRINAGIPVRCLTDEHLLAEHRELKRLPWCLENAIESGSINHIPEKFTLGKGHVLFFLDKQRFIRSRYLDIRIELAKRAFTPQDYIMNWKSVDLKYDNDYTPTIEERDLLIERITERIMNSPKKCFRWYYLIKARKALVKFRHAFHDFEDFKREFGYEMEKGKKEAEEGCYPYDDRDTSGV